MTSKKFSADRSTVRGNSADDVNFRKEKSLGHEKSRCKEGRLNGYDANQDGQRDVKGDNSLECQNDGKEDGDERYVMSKEDKKR